MSTLPLPTEVAFSAPVALRGSTSRRHRTCTLRKSQPICAAACDTNSCGDKLPLRISRRAALYLAAIAATGVNIGPANAIPQHPWSTDVLYDEVSGSFIPPSGLQGLLARDVRRKRFDRCIVASEIHDHPRTHAAQLAVIKRAAEMPDARPLIVGFEQFYRAHTPFLEQYCNGAISLSALLNITQWSNTWGYDVSLYEPIFRFCRANKIPMVGLNIPRRFVSFVTAYGLDGLSKELKTFLPNDVDTSNPKHFEQFCEMMGMAGHVLEQKSEREMKNTLWRWYEAQVVWDEYMSESVAMALEKYPNSRMVTLIGAGHVQGRVGFPARIQKRVRERPYTIVPRAVSWTSDAGFAMPNISAPERDVADIVWYTNRTVDLA